METIATLTICQLIDLTERLELSQEVRDAVKKLGDRRLGREVQEAALQKIVDAYNALESRDPKAVLSRGAEKALLLLKGGRRFSNPKYPGYVAVYWTDSVDSWWLLNTKEIERLADLLHEKESEDEDIILSWEETSEKQDALEIHYNEAERVGLDPKGP